MTLTTIRLMYALSVAFTDFWRPCVQLVCVTAIALLCDRHEPTVLRGVRQKLREAGTQGLGVGMCLMVWVLSGLMVHDGMDGALLVAFHSVAVSSCTFGRWICSSSARAGSLPPSTLQPAEAAAAGVDSLRTWAVAGRLRRRPGRAAPEPVRRGEDASAGKGGREGGEGGDAGAGRWPLETSASLCLLVALGAAVHHLYEVSTSSSSSSGHGGHDLEMLVSPYDSGSGVADENLTAAALIGAAGAWGAPEDNAAADAARRAGLQLTAVTRLGLLQHAGRWLFPVAFSAGVVAAWRWAMWKLPRTFTIGEGLVLVQVATMLLLQSARLLAGNAALPRLLLGMTGLVWAPLAQLSVRRFVQFLLLGLILGAVVSAPLLERFAACARAQALPSRALWALLAATVAAGGLALLQPALWTLRFAAAEAERVGMLLFWAGTLALGLSAMRAAARCSWVPNIILRKGYHVLALLLFVPAARLAPALLYVSLAVAFCALAVVEMVRYGRLPLLGDRIHTFMSSFTDSRDSGPIFVTHFMLLLGIAVPIWFDAGVGRHLLLGSPSSPSQRMQLCSMAGLAVLGAGDTAASLVGSTLGRMPMYRGAKKTVEGFLSGFFACLSLMLALSLLGLEGASFLRASPEPVLLVFDTLLAAAMEAVTTQLDNMVVPLHYHALLASIRH